MLKQLVHDAERQILLFRGHGRVQDEGTTGGRAVAEGVQQHSLSHRYAAADDRYSATALESVLQCTVKEDNRVVDA
ncbi:hypothetical protein Psuf_018930 [Phytohabitans suffuscus]|uniref:Uncharacterized protein n=1 Tax=Phytohabitans suffuscus TaxID=624315 RepID=A0A6F8YET6_9ACTN|nr:hypothetical protein Psuf_018930 [Phytohabitans suffuscus]